MFMWGISETLSTTTALTTIVTLTEFQFSRKPLLQNYRESMFPVKHPI